MNQSGESASQTAFHVSLCSFSLANGERAPNWMAAANLTCVVLGRARKMRARIYLFEREREEHYYGSRAAQADAQ